MDGLITDVADSASDVVGRRLRSDVRIIETAGVVGNDFVHAQAQRRVAATGGPELNANGPLDTLLGER